MARALHEGSAVSTVPLGENTPGQSALGRPRLSYFTGSDGALHIDFDAEPDGLAMLVPGVVLLAFAAATIWLGVDFSAAVGGGRADLSRGLQLVLLLGATCLVGWQVVVGVLWELYGIERLTIQRDSLIVTRTSVGTQRTTTYPVSTITQLRWEEWQRGDADDGKVKVRGIRFYSEDGRLLPLQDVSFHRSAGPQPIRKTRFYRRPPNISIFEGVEQWEAEIIMPLINDRLRRVASEVAT